MGRLRSDGKAVAAILVGAVAGVAGTVVALKAFDGPSSASESVACVEIGAPRVVYAIRGGEGAVVFGSAAPSPAGPLCEDGSDASFAVIRAGGLDRDRVWIRWKDDRIKGDELRLRGEELRQRGAELRIRGEELRVRGEALRARMERLRSGLSDLPGSGTGAGG